MSGRKATFHTDGTRFHWIKVKRQMLSRWCVLPWETHGAHARGSQPASQPGLRSVANTTKPRLVPLPQRRRGAAVPSCLRPEVRPQHHLWPAEREER